jgi:hypothetical protein
MIVPAYRPTPPTQATCYTCQSNCARNFAICEALALAPLAGCIFPPACPAAAAIAGAAVAGCNTTLLACNASCLIDDCCPRRCGPGDPLDGGDGCCDADEQCVSESDPNARGGCCPSNQIVCGSDCCAPGDRCCGNTCCPPNYHCIDNSCVQYPSFGPHTPAPVTVIPPVSSTGTCPPGHFRCRDKCCQNGMSCCGYGCEWGGCIN